MCGSQCPQTTGPRWATFGTSNGVYTPERQKRATRNRSGARIPDLAVVARSAGVSDPGTCRRRYYRTTDRWTHWDFYVLE